jgi:hypothetical protein
LSDWQIWQDWLLGQNSDALNAPFALFIYRYSAPGEEKNLAGFNLERTREFQDLDESLIKLIKT